MRRTQFYCDLKLKLCRRVSTMGYIWKVFYSYTSKSELERRHTCDVNLKNEKFLLSSKCEWSFIYQWCFRAINSGPLVPSLIHFFCFLLLLIIIKEGIYLYIPCSRFYVSNHITLSLTSRLDDRIPAWQTL